MSTLCIYHSDADGRAAAAVVRRALGTKTLLHAINYGDPVPWKKAAEAGKVILVDFSLPRPEMERLAEESQLIWIDHHQSALDALAQAAVNWPGLRSTEEAGCVLAWQYFFPDQPVPQALVLIGDRDIWRWAEADTGPFNEGLQQHNTAPENDQLWQPLLDGEAQLIASIKEQGALLLEARQRRIRRQTAKYGYTVLFEGFRTLALNQRGSGDLGQHIHDLGYQIGYCYIDQLQGGELMTHVTLYSKEVDVSKIAVKFGGGGHPGASGFTFRRAHRPFPPEAEVEYLIEPSELNP